MINIIPRLEFSQVFPDEKQKEKIYYVKHISKSIALRLPGYCNTRPFQNFDNFFTNPLLGKDIFDRVYNYCVNNKIKEKPEIMSVYGGLKLAELIIQNTNYLNEDDIDENQDQNELNIFKCLLIINQELNKKQIVQNVSDDNFEKIVDLCIGNSFAFSDIPPFENDNYEFIKLIYATNVKVDNLLEFLNSREEFVHLKNEFLKSFNVDSNELFRYHKTYLFANLLRLKRENHYIMIIDDQKYELFIESLISEIIIEDPDFTYLKNHPLYRIDEKQFSIINFYFVIEKFYKSAKFKLKEIYQSDKTLKKEYGDFFNFFNKHFSENFLMKGILDKIFPKKFHIKKKQDEIEKPNEPDYYVRHNNTIYLFENKDVWVAKKIKSSFDINEINNLLSLKFLKNDDGDVGIGQLVYHIKEILSKSFRFDDYVNTKNNLTIYPILLIHDRIFQILGVNYRLDSWFLKSLSNVALNKDCSHIKHLTVIDIDTLIFLTSYFIKKDKYFEEIIKDHLFKMIHKKNIYGKTKQEIIASANKNTTEQLSPIADRNHSIDFDIEQLVNQFREINIDKD